MSNPSPGTAAQTLVLQKQTFDKQIDLLENCDRPLDKMFTDMGPQTITSLQNFRIQLQTEMGGGFAAANTDGGSYMPGTAGTYDQGVMTPFEMTVGIVATDQEIRIGSSGKDVIVVDPVTRMVADVHRKLPIKRNNLLQGYNTGQVGTIGSTYAGSGANPIVMDKTFGARLLDKNDFVQVMSGDGNYTLRGTAYVVDLQRNGGLSTNTITLDAVPGGTVAGDFIMIAGVAAGTPLFFNGLTYIVSPATTGEYLGMSRSLSYTQSPAFNANGALLTLGIVQAFLTRMQQALGMDSFSSDRKANFWYGHTAQQQSWKTLGFAEQQIFIGSDGKVANYDGLESPFKENNIGGIRFMIDTKAAVDKLYFLDKSTLVRCRLNKSPEFVQGQIDGIWFKRPNGSGGYTSYNDAWLYDAVNYATRNPWANGVIYNLGTQAILG